MTTSTDLIIPIFFSLTMLVVIAFFFRSQKLRGRLPAWFRNFHLSFSRRDVAIALLGIAIIFAINWFLWSPVPESGALVLVAKVLVGPVFEEVAMRGILFGALLYAAERRLQARHKKLLVVPLLLLQSFLFLVLHYEKFSAGGDAVTATFINGLIYGALFLLSKRNILPGIAAHAAHNYLTVIAGI